jgi:hypothetical protein
MIKSKGLDPSILRHSEMWVAADEAILNNVYKKIQKTLFNVLD